jgi:hypothetical protein
MKRLLFLAIIFALPLFAFGQVRPVDNSATEKKVAAPAPASFSAKYEGGMYGFSKKQTGTLKFDDTSLRLVFYGEDGKELFGLPYDALLVIYPQSQSVTSTTGNVVKNIPLPGAVLGGYIKEKRSYLIIQFHDPDVEASGTINFKLDSKELLDSVLQTLADKAGMQQRGDAYYKPRGERRGA